MTARGSDSGRFNLRLALLVVEGYLYLLLVLAIFAGTLALLAWGFVARRPLVALASLLVGAPLLATAGAAIRALCFPLPEPAGIPLQPSNTPALHALVEALRREVCAPKVDMILVVEGLNASAVQSARWAIWGTRHTLLLGFPLFALLSHAQLRAVVAHELAHLSRADARFARWVYRTRVSWLRLVHALHRRQTVPVFVHWLFRLYVPRLQARSAEISRAQEFRADRVAARVTGAQTVADTLRALEAGQAFLEERFWPEFFERRRTGAAVPRPFQEIAAEFRRARLDGTLERLLSHGRETRSDPDDMHPSLGERLSALGMADHIPAAAEEDAGVGGLGPHLQGIAERLDAGWLDRHGSAWSERCGAEQRLAELEVLVSPGPAEMLERARLVEELRSPAAALPVYLAARAAHPPGAQAALAAGRILLHNDEPGGTTLIEQAMQSDDTLIPEGCALLARFHRERGRVLEADCYEQRARRQATRARMAKTERDTLAATDDFAPPGADAASVARLVGFLGRDSGVAEAFLTDKRLRYSPGRQRILAVLPRRNATPGLAERIKAQGLLPADMRVVLLASDRGPLPVVLRSIPQARIYPAAGTRDGGRGTP